MQILHFNWLRYQRTISNSPRVAKLAQSSVTLSFVLFPNEYFFNLHLLTLLLPFLSDWLGDTKTIRPYISSKVVHNTWFYSAFCSSEIWSFSRVSRTCHVALQIHCIVHQCPFSILAKENHCGSKLSYNMDVLMIRFQRRKQRKLKFYTTTLQRHWLWRKKKWWVLKNHWRLPLTHSRNNSKTRHTPGQCYRLVRPSLHITDATATTTISFLKAKFCWCSNKFHVMLRNVTLRCVALRCVTLLKPEGSTPLNGPHEAIKKQGLNLSWTGYSYFSVVIKVCMYFCLLRRGSHQIHTTLPRHMLTPRRSVKKWVFCGFKIFIVW